MQMILEEERKEKCHRWLLVFSRNIWPLPSGQKMNSALKMEAVGSSETLAAIYTMSRPKNITVITYTFIWSMLRGVPALWLFYFQSFGCSVGATLHTVARKAAITWFLWPGPWSILRTSHVVADHDSRTVDPGIGS
jgi:hypothetical protein